MWASEAAALPALPLPVSRSHHFGLLLQKGSYVKQREVSHNLLQQLPHLCLVLSVSIEDERDLAMWRALLCSAAEVADARLHVLAELLQGLVGQRLLEQQAEAEASIEWTLLGDVSQLRALRAAAKGRVVGCMQVNVPSPQLMFEMKAVNGLSQLLLLHHAREYIEDEASGAVLLGSLLCENQKAV